MIKQIVRGFFLSLVVMTAAGITTAQERITLNMTGTVTAARSVPLAFGIPGVVAEVFVEVGQSVAAGETLARLETTDLELMLRATELRLNEQQVRFDQLTSPARPEDLAVAQAAMQVARASANAAYAAAPSGNAEEIARLQSELARNQLWQAQLQRGLALAVNPEFRNTPTQSANAQEIQLNGGLAQLELGVEIADINAARVRSEGPDLAQLGQANASITQAQIQLDRLTNGPDAEQVRLAEIALDVSRSAVEQSQLDLENAVITAPFDGIITAQNLVVGQQPPAGQPALLLADTTSYVVELLVDEMDVVYLNEGQTVTLTFNALPGTEISGTISNIGLLPVANSAVPQYRVSVVLESTDAPVRAGMKVNAVLIVS